MTSKQKQFTAAIERARPGAIAELEKIARKVITNPVFPPIPTCKLFDWAAVFEDYEPGQHVGYGRNAQEATADLLEQWEDDR